MVVALVTNTNGQQAAPTNTTAPVDALKGEIGNLTKQIEELTKARAADQQTFSDSIRRQEDAAKKLISVEHKQDLRIEQIAMKSVKEGIDLGQSLLTNSIIITLTVAGIFVTIGGFVVWELGKMQLAQEAKYVLDTRNKVEGVEEDLTETNWVTRGLASLSPGIPKFEIDKTRNELESYLTSHPTARRVAIVLARIYIADDSLPQAIAILDYRFLKAKTDLQTFDSDYADALYNRACYKVKLWKKTGDVKFKDQAYEDLTKSIATLPMNKADAQNDEDFKPLWEEDRFRALVGT